MLRKHVYVTFTAKKSHVIYELNYELTELNWTGQFKIELNWTWTELRKFHKWTELTWTELDSSNKWTELELELNWAVPIWSELNLKLKLLQSADLGVHHFVLRLHFIFNQIHDL